MKKITQNDFSKKMAKYGALSLAIAGVADASGQIIYTDVNPDVTVGAGSFVVDFDGDGVDDLTVIQSNTGAYELATTMAGSSAGVLAASNGGFFYASNLTYGTAIDGGVGSFRSIGDLCADQGQYTGSQFCGTGPGYLGVEFDISGATHYGWVRIDVLNSSNIIVMDYAYESTPDMAIAAGEFTLGIADNNFEGFNYFVDKSSQLNLSANTPMEKISLHNTLGQEVISQKLNSNSEVLNLSALKTGIYLATVSIEGASKTVKIIKN